MARHLATLGLVHRTLSGGGHMNDNVAQGFGATVVAREDVDAFERFRDQLPASALAQIAYFRDYDPARLHRSSSNATAALA
jgi:hypothetical protein